MRPVAFPRAFAVSCLLAISALLRALGHEQARRVRTVMGRNSSRFERIRRWLGTLVPGLITGAANDDPCAIGTYAKAGATFGFSFLWTAPLTSG